MTLNGTVATFGDKGEPGVSKVLVDGLEVNLDPNMRYFALHKPTGVVTTMRDPQGRPDITQVPAVRGSSGVPRGQARSRFRRVCCCS